MARIVIDGKELLVIPPKHPSKEVKDVLGGRWDKKRRAWRLPPTSMNVIQLVDWYGDEILEDAPWPVRHLAKADWGFTGFGVDNRHLHHNATSHPRWDDLYDFQKEAVEYLVCNPHRGAILGLEPGLGKAPTSIVAMDVIEATRVLIVAPLTLARNWMRELDDWQRLYRSWSRATRTEKDPITECVVTNYEVLFESIFYDEFGDEVNIDNGWALTYDEDGEEEWIRASPTNMRKWINDGPTVLDKRKDKDVPARKRIVEPRRSYDKDWDLIIIDESILLKNRRAVKVNILQKLSAYAENVWLLSGSATARFRIDLFPQLQLIMPRGFKSYWRFADFFCTVDRNQWGWKIDGDRPDHDPQSYLRDFAFFRSQKDVLPELPEYIFDPIEVDLNPDQAKAFKGMSDDWVSELEDGEKVAADIALAQITRLAQITSNMVNVKGKQSSAKEDLLIDLLVADDIELPMVVWCWWVPTTLSVFDRLYSETDLAVDYVIGAMKGSEKDEALDAYKAGKSDIIVLQMGVGKFGHTLTDTRTVFYHDRHFDSDAYYQSLRRVRRIGLEHRPRLIVPRAPVSADPAIELNLSGKMQSIARLGNKDLRELLMSIGAGMEEWSINRVD